MCGKTLLLKIVAKLKYGIEISLQERDWFSVGWIKLDWCRIL
jgi:hypothetical protein